MRLLSIFLLALYHPQVASSLPTLRMGMLCTDADLGTFSRPRCYPVQG